MVSVPAVNTDMGSPTAAGTPIVYDGSGMSFGSGPTGQMLFSQTATQTIANTGTATTILSTGVGSLTLPANFFTAGRTLRVEVGGVFSTLITPGNLTVVAKLGSVTIGTVVISNLLASASNNAFSGQCDIACRTTGASGTVMLNGEITYEVGVLLRGSAALTNSGATSTIDTTATQVVNITAQWATASASNSLSCTTAATRSLN